MPDHALNETFDYYRLTEKLGDSPAGSLYKAEDTRLSRTIALRFLPATLTGNPAAFARFNRDVRATFALHHPNISLIYETGRHQDRWFVVTEFVDGAPLSQLLARRRFESSERLHLAVDIANTLDAAHSQGILHRHMNSANIFITDRGPKILNFGLASLAEPTPAALAYQSPEQLCGHEPDTRSDIFSLGAVLYAIVTNRPPFSGDTPAALREAILSHSPAPPYSFNSDIKPRLVSAIFKAMEKDPSLRYQRVADMVTDLRDSNAHDPGEVFPH